MTSPIPQAARTRNLSPARSLREFCRWCADTGNVLVSTRTQTFAKRSKGRVTAHTSEPLEEYGPCPYCEMGYDLEFPPEEDIQPGKRLRPPWGSHGFWQGREPVDIAPLYTDPTPLPAAENRRRMAQLSAQIAKIGPPIPGDSEAASRDSEAAEA